MASNRDNVKKDLMEKKMNRLKKFLFIFFSLLISVCVLEYMAVPPSYDGRNSGFGYKISQIPHNIVSNPLAIFSADLAMVYLLLGLGILLAWIFITSEADKARLRKVDPLGKGTARFMDLKDYEAYNKRFTAPLGMESIDGAENMILSQKLRLAMDNRGTRRNFNTLIFGGSGAGKSRFFAGPNIMQANCNFVITDPSGELLEDYGKMLQGLGYEVKTFNIVDTYSSNKYNPFHYIKKSSDVYTIVNTLIKNTTPPEKSGGEPIWENGEKLLIESIMLYMWNNFAPQDQTFNKLMEMVNWAEINDSDKTFKNKLDVAFEDYQKNDPGNLACKLYSSFKKGAGKTLQSFVVSVTTRLNSFFLDEIDYLTKEDNFHFETFADTKQAIFVIIPTAEDTFNFIVSMLYSQLFSSLYTYSETTCKYGWKASIDKLTNLKVVHANNKKESKQAEAEIRRYVAEIQKGVKVKYDKKEDLYKVYTKETNELVGWRGTKELLNQFLKDLQNITIEQCGRRCPTHVRLILDEFANIGQIPTFDQKISTMRKYEISCSIILQTLSQLEEIYDKKANTIVGNCDTKIFLGSDDPDTINWLIDSLGDQTVKVGQSSYQHDESGGSDTVSTDSQKLITYDQVTLMDDDECIVRVRGVRPYFGKKYDIEKHPNYGYAQATKGQFVVDKNIPEGFVDRSIPYRLRKQDKFGVKREETKNGTTPLPETPKKETPRKETPRKETPAEKEERKKRNEKRKQDAEAVTGKKENLQNGVLDIDSKELAAALGLDPDSGIDIIKEAMETICEIPEEDSKKILEIVFLDE